MVDFGRSARRKNNDTDGRAAVDRERERKKILKTRPNDYIYIQRSVTNYGGIRSAAAAAAAVWCPERKTCFFPLFLPLYFFLYFLFFTMELTPFIIGVYFERDNVEPFRACRASQRRVARGFRVIYNILYIILHTT